MSSGETRKEWRQKSPIHLAQQPGAIFVFLILVFFVLIFHHYAVLCVIVLIILCSVHRPVSQHYNILIPGRKCLIGVNNTQTNPAPLEVAWVQRLWCEWGTLLVVLFTVNTRDHSHQPTLSAVITQCWDWWLLLSNFEILQTSRSWGERETIFFWK